MVRAFIILVHARHDIRWEYTTDQLLSLDRKSLSTIRVAEQN